MSTKAMALLKRLNGLGEKTNPVPESRLPALLCQAGTGCDCKGCDKDS